MARFIVCAFACALAGCASSHGKHEHVHQDTKLDWKTEDRGMQLGNFSISLAVKDLQASRAFYEKLGLHVTGGNGKNFSIMQNDTCTIGLFQGMFDKNILTFNPGWDRACTTLPEFDDVRAIQAELKAQGLTLASEADASSTGPANIVLVDPDGNQVLIDQHVAKPGA